ncbi:Uncharacterised protein [Atlantibacter hermannii]|nr:Uncharacterised protein [Atlantibacter hermannii]
MTGSENAVEMGVQRTIRRVRIAVADRLDNNDMLLIAHVIMLMQLLVGHRRARRDKPVEKGDVDRHKDRIAGNFRQHAVEFDV